MSRSSTEHLPGGHNTDSSLLLDINEVENGWKLKCSDGRSVAPSLEAGREQDSGVTARGTIWPRQL